MSQVASRVFDFTLMLTGADELTIDVAEALYSVIDDASLHSEGAAFRLDFHREAESLGDAIGSAVKDVERAGYRVARVDVDAVDA